MKVRKARINDAESILRIAEDNQLNEEIYKSNSANGFLVSGFNLQDYKNMIKEYEHFYVVEFKKSISTPL